MKLLTMTLIFFATATSVAGESGFFYQGQKNIIYKDGKKIGPTYEEFLSKDKRNPSQVSHHARGVVYYEATSAGMCHYMVGGSQGNESVSLSCISVGASH
jgi:hypothetical protein